MESRKFLVLKMTLAECEKRDERAEKYNYLSDTCIICGRPLKETDTKMLHLLPDGSLVDDEHDQIEVPQEAELGYWLVGKTCYREFRLRRAVMTDINDIKI